MILVRILPKFENMKHLTQNNEKQTKGSRLNNG